MPVEIQTNRPRIIANSPNPQPERQTASSEQRKINNEPLITSHEPQVASRERRVSFVTLGCKVNQTETEAIAQLFRQANYQVVGTGETADVVVINTCTVTNIGDSKSRQVIRRMIRKHPESLIAVMGCYAQTAPGEVLGIEGVDLVIGTRERMKILDWLEGVEVGREPRNAVQGVWEAEGFEELPQLREEQRARAYIKIQDGCNQCCTYCIIPTARGPSRSRLPENVLAEAQRLAVSGYPEVVLTGIHTGYYGQDLGEQLGQEWNLASLLYQLIDIPGIKRLRLSSIEPMEYTDELIACLASSPKICPHVQIPLQSGNDRILAKMNRLYTVSEYKNLLERLRRRIPNLAVTTDLITGFPGETEDDHAAVLEFVKDCSFAGINVFPYSQRKGTPASNYPDQVPRQVKERRVKELLMIARFSQKEFVQRFLGTQVEVLVERVDGQGWGIGYTPHYIQVRIPAGVQSSPLAPRQFVKLVLEEGMVESG